MAEQAGMTAFVEVGATIDQLEKQLNRAEAMARQKVQEIERQAQIDLGGRLGDLDTKIAAARARVRGDGFEARMIELEASYDREIRAATNAEERKRLEMLKTLRVQEEIDRERITRAQAVARAEAIAARRADQERRTRGGGGEEGTFGIGAFGRGLLGAFAGLNAVEAGAKGLSAVVAIMRGDWEKAAQHVEQLPLGIGQAIRSVSGLIDELRGVNAELERRERLAEMIERREARLAQRRVAANELRQMERSAEEEARVLGITDPTLRAIGEIDAERAREVGMAEQAGLEAKAPRAVIDEAIAAINERYDARIRAIRDGEAREAAETLRIQREQTELAGLSGADREIRAAQQERERQEEAKNEILRRLGLEAAAEFERLADEQLRQRLERIKRDAQAEAQAKTEAAMAIAEAESEAMIRANEEFFQKRADIVARNEDLALRQAGRTLEADLREIDRRIDEQIDATRKRGDDFGADQLEQTRALEREARLRQEADAITTRDITGDRLRFDIPQPVVSLAQTGPAGGTSGSGPQREQVVKDAQIPQVIRLLQELVNFVQANLGQNAFS